MGLASHPTGCMLEEAGVSDKEGCGEVPSHEGRGAIPEKICCGKLIYLLQCA